MSAPCYPFPTFTALLLVTPVDAVPLLVADPAELDASAVLAALELCRAHCMEGKRPGIIRCEVRVLSEPVGSAAYFPAS